MIWQTPITRELQGTWSFIICRCNHLDMGETNCLDDILTLVDFMRLKGYILKFFNFEQCLCMVHLCLWIINLPVIL
jgi:hypothetical protein